MDLLPQNTENKSVMMSPTSQPKAEHILERISVLTFSSFDNRDIVVVLTPVNSRRSFL